MNLVPGVMQLESNGSAGTSSPRFLASWIAAESSCAARKRRWRCWFILARGAHPSTARKRSFWGLTIFMRLSTNLPTAKNISSSVRLRKGAVISVRTRVDDPVHVKIKVVELPGGGRFNH